MPLVCVQRLVGYYGTTPVADSFDPMVTKNVAPLGTRTNGHVRRRVISRRECRQKPQVPNMLAMRKTAEMWFSY